MLLSKKNFKLLHTVLERWHNDGTISGPEMEKLKGSLEVQPFDWKRLAKYSFWIAGISLGIALFSLFLDDAILAIIAEFLGLPEIVKSLLLAFVALAFYLLGFLRKRRNPERFFSSEFLLFVGAIFTGGAVTFFGMAVDNGSGNYPLLILMSAFVYLLVGALFPSAPMWVIGLLSIGSWLGTETGYISGWGAYFLGMNYPMRFVLFGGLLIAASFLIKKGRCAHLQRSTFITGLLFLFLSLWLMSIFGNYGDIFSWHEASIIERFFWSLIFGAAAVGAIIFGLKSDDGASRGFGITFLFINLYTKYFEYFWSVTHKAIFFVILALSFWLVGRYSEKAVNLLKEKLVDTGKAETSEGE